MQGAGAPLVQTTVVVLPGGTTTVVCSAGCGVLVLLKLKHPANASGPANSNSRRVLFALMCMLGLPKFVETGPVYRTEASDCRRAVPFGSRSELW